MGLNRTRDTLTGAVQAMFPDPAPTIYSAVPERIVPPCVVLRPADDYITTPVTFGGSRVVKFELVLVTKPGRNNTSTDDLDKLLDTVIAGLTGRDDYLYQSDDITAPFIAEFADNNYLCVAVPVACDYQP